MTYEAVILAHSTPGDVRSDHRETWNCDVWCMKNNGSISFQTRTMCASEKFSYPPWYWEKCDWREQFNKAEFYIREFIIWESFASSRVGDAENNRVCVYMCVGVRGRKWSGLEKWKNALLMWGPLCVILRDAVSRGRGWSIGSEFLEMFDLIYFEIDSDSYGFWLVIELCWFTLYNAWEWFRSCVIFLRFS